MDTQQRFVERAPNDILYNSRQNLRRYRFAWFVDDDKTKRGLTS